MDRIASLITYAGNQEPHQPAEVIVSMLSSVVTTGQVGKPGTPQGGAGCSQESPATFSSGLAELARHRHPLSVDRPSLAGFTSPDVNGPPLEDISCQ